MAPRLLFDEHLAVRLVGLLQAEYPGSVHVRDAIGRAATDEQIWEYARSSALVIVSKDEDFQRFSVWRGFPPKVIWIQLGNCSTDDVSFAPLRRRKPPPRCAALNRHGATQEMMRLTLVLLSFVAGAVSQVGEGDAHILRWFIASELGARPTRPLLVSILPDSSTATAGPLLQQLRALGIPVVPLTVRPGRDTLYLRVTRPFRDSLDYYRLGVERLTCRDGRLLGGRTVVSLRCVSGSCHEHRETPMGGGELDLGSCGRP